MDSRNYIPVESIVGGWSLTHTGSHVDSSPVLDTVKVIQYDDCDLEPPFIGPRTFFSRHTFHPNIKHVTVSLLYWLPHAARF